MGAHKHAGAEGAQGLCRAGRRERCDAQHCSGGDVAVAGALAIIPLTGFQLLQPFSRPVSGLRSIARQVIHFTRLALPSLFSLIRLQVIKPERDPLSACVLDRPPLDGVPKAGNHHCGDTGCW